MVMLVFPRNKSLKAVREAYSSGMEPVIRLLYKSKCCKVGSKDNAGGSLPAQDLTGKI